MSVTSGRFLITLIMTLFLTAVAVGLLGYKKINNVNSFDGVRTTYRLPIAELRADAIAVSSSPAFDKEDNNQIILMDVPFVVQAPFSNWDNIIFQGACEEASILMAVHWVKGEDVSDELASREIIEMAHFQEEAYGHFYDSSAKDTASLIKDYFGYKNVSLRYGVGGQDIKNELAGGNIMIVPVNGQKLKNPHYTPPGPIAHTLVIVGYDPNTKEFITHDPGTQWGKYFRYDENIFVSSLQDYPTGHLEPIVNPRSAMIVVTKN